MRLLRFRTARRAFGLGLAVVPAVACAGGDEKVNEAEAPDASPPAVIDGGTPSELDATDDAPVAAIAGCSDDGFCYEPIPRASPLIAVSASSLDEAWMLPDSSRALYRWDGTSIRQVYEYEAPSPLSIKFTNLWAQTKDHVWAAARGSADRLVLVRYASPPGGGAAAFRELPTDVPWTGARPVWGTPAGDALWIANDDEVLRVREGASGAVVEHLTLTDAEDPRGFAWSGIWGFGPDDVYVAGKLCPSSPCGATSEGAIAHYDGTTWSIMTVDATRELGSLRGTPSGTTRQLWYTARSAVPGPTVQTSWRTDLVPITADGVPEAVIYSHKHDDLPLCSSAIGQATSPMTGWFSDGLLLCRWTGTAFEPARTVVEGRVIVSNVRGIWASGTDDAWVVGTAVSRPGLPAAGFAARRTAKTARGEKP